MCVRFSFVTRIFYYKKISELSNGNMRPVKMRKFVYYNDKTKTK